MKSKSSTDKKNVPHRWSFYRAGGVDQVRLDKGADITNLDQLDQKLWVALSCPTKGLEIDSRTLELLDSDNDGHVRPPEILNAAAWLKDVLANPDCLTEGKDGVVLANLRQDTEEGRILKASAEHMLTSLELETTSISTTDARRTREFFETAERNGDGVVPPDTIEEEPVRKVAEEIVACLGGADDRSGKKGYDKALLETFFTALTEYDEWLKSGEKEAATILPFGDKTGAAFTAFTAVRAKIDDYFGRCRLAAFDPRALNAVNLEEKQYIEAAAKDLTITTDELQHFPLAMAEADKPLPLTREFNPAWGARLSAFREACCPDNETLAEAGWLELCRKFDAHAAWVGKKAGAVVEPLGVDRIRQILKGKSRPELEKAIEEDLEVADWVNAMERVEKLAHLHRDFHTLLNNYVSFSDFYARRGSIFQAGTLYLDGRACDMCFHVNDAARHAKMAPMSNAFLAYVDCTRPGGEKLSVACAFTAGDSDNLFEGRNGIFYDRNGRDWDATITKIVSNPISIREAFWSPYKKVLRSVQETIAKKAAEADKAADAKLASGVASVGDAAKSGNASAAPKSKFDVGTIAALGVAVSGITGVFTALLTGFLGLGIWIPFGIIGLLLAISGPSMFIAWLKLRTRNLGPILDANGWAVNTLTRVNIPLGTSLTELPVIPSGSARTLTDPYAPKKSIWPRLFLFLAIVGAVGYLLYRTNTLHNWFPEHVPAHHTELAMKADKIMAAPGESVELTISSPATTLQVTDTSDANAPKELAALTVENGKAALAIPAEMTSGSLTVHDSLSGSKVKISIVPAAQ